MQNLSYENEFDLMHQNEPEGRTHFHMNGFAQRLVLPQRHKVHHVQCNTEMAY